MRRRRELIGLEENVKHGRMPAASHFCLNELTVCVLSGIGLDSQHMGNDASKQRPKASATQEDLVIAAQQGDLLAVKAALNGGAEVNLAADGQTPLHLACGCAGLRKDHISILKLLSEAGANLNQGDNAGRTALHYLVTSVQNIPHSSAGHVVEAMRFCVASGAHVNVLANDGTTALHLSARIGHLEGVQALLELGADIEAKMVDRFTPLSWAAANRHYDTCFFLLRCGANSNVPVPGATLPLLQYALQTDTTLGRVVIAAGVNLNCKTGAGVPIIFCASRDILLACIAAGGDPFVKNTAGQSLLFHLLDDRRLLERLLDMGLDPNVQDSSGDTVLHHCMSEHWAQRERGEYNRVPVATIVLLLDRGADLRIRNKGGKTALDLDGAQQLRGRPYITLQKLL